MIKTKQIPWNKGKKCQYLIGNTYGFKKGKAPWNKGLRGCPPRHTKPHTEKVRRKLSEINKGKPWNEARRKAQLFIVRKKQVKRLRTKPFIVGNGREYHPLWGEIRKLVYKRDNWTCQECGVHCHNTKRINAHHIDYDITNNDLFNLITLCASCHMKTNFKRIDWIKHYMENRVKPVY